MMKENDSFAEPRFPVRSYGKGELAMYYLPGIAQQHEPLLPTVHARAGAAYD